MKSRKQWLGLIAIVVAIAGTVAFERHPVADDAMISYTVDPAKQDIRLYWKDDSGQVIGNFQHLRNYINSQHRHLVFAMNGGMFQPDYSPVGLFIQQGKTIRPLNRSTGGGGNFNLQPNGVFYITNDNNGVICTTDRFVDSGQVKFATQSGPMLLIDGAVHPAFTKGSSNLNIRNGVGVLPGNKLLFAMSKEGINFYDFAMYFKNKGCREALYLDGFVSQTYLPEKHWVQTGGNFGVLIGVSNPNKYSSH